MLKCIELKSEQNPGCHQPRAAHIPPWQRNISPAPSSTCLQPAGFNDNSTAQHFRSQSAFPGPFSANSLPSFLKGSVLSEAIPFPCPHGWDRVFFKAHLTPPPTLPGKMLLLSQTSLLMKPLLPCLAVSLGFQTIWLSCAMVCSYIFGVYLPLPLECEPVEAEDGVLFPSASSVALTLHVAHG